MTGQRRGIRETPPPRNGRAASACLALALALALTVPTVVLAAAPELELETCHRWVVAATAALEQAPPDPALQAYRQAYMEAFPIDRARPIDRETLGRRLASARTVLVGDQHDSAAAKTLLVEVMTAMRAAGPVTLAVEFVAPRFQAHLDAFHEHRIDEGQVRELAYEPSHWSFPWRLYLPLFTAARALGVRIVAVEPGTELALAERDAGIERAVRAIPGRVVVFYGSAHLLGRGHLADRLTADLVVTPTAFDRYWTLARRHGPSAELLELSDRVVFANQGPPFDQDLSYLLSLMQAFGYRNLDELAADLPQLRPVPALGPLAGATTSGAGSLLER